MTPTATYIAEENCLQEISQMADPGTCPNELDGIEKCDACKNLAVSYAAHLATLRKIPCSPEPGFKDGEKYSEGVDYEIKGADEWKWCYQLKGNIFAAPIVSVKGEPDMPNLILTAFQNEPVTFLLSNALRHLTQDQQRQLCNALQERLPLPGSIEQEAERLYPFPEDNESGVYDDLKNIREWCRSAHITCARQYMGEIEKLKAELEQSLLLYNNQTATIMKLQAENSKMRKALEGIAYFTSVDLNWMKQTAVEALK